MIRVLLADDQKILREGLKMIIEMGTPKTVPSPRYLYEAILTGWPSLITSAIPRKKLIVPRVTIKG